MKVNIGGEQVDGEEMDFQSINEMWNEYACDDGSVVRIKVVVSKVTRLVGKFNLVGEPVYLIGSSNVVSVTPAPGLSRKT